jgi:transmembrane sensor
MTDENAAICDQAAHWIVRLNSDQRTRTDDEAFRVWLEQDKAHAHAFADSLALWDSIGEMVGTDEAHELLRPLRAPGRGRRNRLSRRAAVLGAFGAASAAAASAAIGLMLYGEQTLQTAPGEQKRARLSDGSGVLLNTDTRLRVKFSSAERRLFLDRGQAFFQVATDPTRPFRVFAGPKEVRAIGTAFEVRRMGDTVQITLEEGRVAIFGGDGASSLARPQSAPRPIGAPIQAPPSIEPDVSRPAAVLVPGEQAVLNVAGDVEVRRVDLRTVQAWRYGRMILDDAPLGQVVADLNRYGGVQIVLADPNLATVRVSGVFHTGRPDDFVEAITAAFPIEIVRQDQDSIVLKSR